MFFFGCCIGRITGVKLGFVDECGYVVDLESGGLVGADRYEETDEEVVDLVDQVNLSMLSFCFCFPFHGVL